MGNPSASGLQRADPCPASCALPQADIDSPAAKRGSAGHLFLALVPKLGEKAALAKIPEEYREACEALDLEGLPLDPAEYRQEVAYAINARTGQVRELGEMLERAYKDLGPDEIPGTLDVIGKRGVVRDYKWDGFESYAPAPCSNHQLAFGARALSELAGIDEVDVGLIHFRQDGSRWEETAVLGPFELEAFAGQLADIVRRVRIAEDQVRAGAVPDVRRGEWCRYCPALPQCPAVTTLIRAMSGEPVKTAEELLKLLTPETAARAYERYQAIRDALKPFKQALWLYGSDHKIGLPDGRCYGSVVSEKKEINARTARQVLGKVFNPDVADTACNFDTSEAAIERGVRLVYEPAMAAFKEAKERGEKPAKPSLKAMKETALSEIEKAGGVKYRTVVKVREHRYAPDGTVVDAVADEDIPF